MIEGSPSKGEAVIKALAPCFLGSLKLCLPRLKKWGS